MDKTSKIESFFNSLNLGWQDLIELLPIGVLLFDENWKISSINKNFITLFKDTSLAQNLDGINLFSKNYLSDKLPLKELLQLRENKDFEKVLHFKDVNESQFSLIFKGSPIFSNGVFKGGTIIAEKFLSDSSESKSSYKFENSITNFLSKISNSFLIVNLNGIIEAVSTNLKTKHEDIYGREGEDISNVFSSESDLSLKSIFLDTINKKKPNYSNLTYFSDTEYVSLKSVLIPILDEENEVSKVAVLLREKNNIDEDSISHLSDSIKLKEFESFAIANSDGIFKINFHGNITFWAENAAALFDVNEKNIVNKFIGNVFPEITQEYFEQIRIKIIKNDSWEGYLLSEVLSDDNLFRVKIISKSNNQKTDLFVYCNKIDKHQQRLISAREEEKLFFKDAVLKSNQMILQANPNGTILFANDKFCDVFKFELDEIRGKHFNDLIENKYKAKNNLNDIESIVSSKDFQIIPLTTKLDRIVEVCISVNISTANSELKYFTIYLKECSLKDKLFLETSHALLYQFANPVLIVDEEQIIKVNPKFCELFGSEFEADFFNLPASEIIDPSSDLDFREILSQKTVSESPNFIKFIKMDGNTVSARVKKICCSKESTFSVLVLQPEGFEEKPIVSLSDRIKSKFLNLGPFYWSGSFEKEELQINYIDSAFIKSIGFNYTDAFSQIDFLNEITHPDDMEKVNAELSNVIIDGLERTINYRIINKSGEIVWISNKVKPESAETRKQNALIGS
ncbi:MAG: PAS domain-containing protein, partial [Melioribacteraceae bacterium]|nr:PAS domain-containing protein [Melioribacteraceae bacterium]